MRSPLLPPPFPFVRPVWCVCAGAGGGAGCRHPLDVSRRQSPSLSTPTSLPALPLLSLSLLSAPISPSLIIPSPISPCSLPPPQLSNIYLTGPLPSTVTALTQLQALRMGNNFLAGQLPPLQGAPLAQPPAPLLSSPLPDAALSP